MGLVSRTADTIYTFRFLRLLTTPWKKMGAYEAGIIDKDGKVIRKATSDEEKDVYNTFHKLVFNIKRMLNKIPFGKTTIASYAAALLLLREETGMTESEILEMLNEACDTTFELDEFRPIILSESSVINEGDILEHKTEGLIKVDGSIGYSFGKQVFMGESTESGDKIAFVINDIRMKTFI